MQYINDTNNETLSKLNNHIDFLNKENHRLNEEIRRGRADFKRAQNFVNENDSLQITIHEMKV
jgi:hypothetical protein